MAMCRIPAGWCWMGSEGRYDWESPRHRVFIDGFELGTTTVRRGEYARFLNETVRQEPVGWTAGNFSDPDQPVVGVSWFDAMAYCEWLSRESNETYRLPTEAEWEKACKGGHDDYEYAWGHEPAESLDRYLGEWHGPARATEGTANGYGLLHMGDNVHEWCHDWYAPSYYAISPERNPLGPEAGSRRVSRGGSWRHRVKGTRAAHRSSLPPAFRYTDYGFRMARAVSSIERL